MGCRFLTLALAVLLVGSLGCGCKLTDESITSLEKQESKWHLAEKELMDVAPTEATRMIWKERVKAFCLVIRAIKADAKGEDFDMETEAKDLGIVMQKGKADEER